MKRFVDAVSDSETQKDSVIPPSSMALRRSLRLMSSVESAPKRLCRFISAPADGCEGQASAAISADTGVEGGVHDPHIDVHPSESSSPAASQAVGTASPEASRMLLRIKRSLVLRNRHKSVSARRESEVPPLDDVIESCRGAAHVHKLLSGRDVEDPVDVGSSASTPCVTLQMAPPSFDVRTPQKRFKVDDHDVPQCPNTSLVSSVRSVPGTHDDGSYFDCVSADACEEFITPVSTLRLRDDEIIPASSVEEIVAKYYSRSPHRALSSADALLSPGSPANVSVPGRIPVSTNDNIKVVVRCRPVDDSVITAVGLSGNVVEVHKPGNSNSVLDSQRPRTERYAFDSVFDGHATQQEVFECTCQVLIPGMFCGLNGTVFAYGCTSAGKTFTMLGDESVAGIVQLSINSLFDAIEERQDGTEVRFSFLEVYNESVYDLLTSGCRSVDIQEDSGDVRVPQMTSTVLTDREHALSLLAKGIKSRKMAMTAANRQSSRSHAIMQFSVSSLGCNAKLSFIDLAGSERAGSGGAHHEHKKESSYINQSLLALANCISSLSEGPSGRCRVKYRDSKLTLLLKNCLFSTSRVVMITAIHPGVQFLHESLQSLKYARRAKAVRIPAESQPPSPPGLPEYTAALRESYMAISLIGRSLPSPLNRRVVDFLQSCGLCGTLALLGLLSGG